MATTLRTISAHDELRRVLRDVRRRWRLRLVLRGAALVVVVAVLGTVLAAAGVERLQLEPRALLLARLGIGAGVLAAAVWAIVLPLLRRAPDRQVALYLEEHEPSLDAAVLSAVDCDAPGAAPSPFAGRLAELAVARTRQVEHGRRVERQPLRVSGGALGAAALAALLLLTLGPDAVRRAARLVFLPQPAAAEPMRRFIEVQPGDAELARGGDQLVRAQLNGFASDSVLLVLRATSDSASAGSWDRIPMVPDSGGAFSLRLFDVAAPTEYYVESDGIRSPTYRLKVTDLPFVDRIDLAYTYPAYTGLAPDSTLDGGDVAAPLGTAVRVRTTTTLPVPAGQLVIEERDTVPLAPQPDGTLAGTLTVRRPGFYRVELQGADGRMVTGSLDYTIDVIEDRPPTVRIAKPGRDSRPTTLEEVFTEARADDDYGVAKLELVYSVNGGPEQTVPLHQGRPLREVTAGHTFFLEEFGLAPGDLVSYYARATDGNRASGPQTATTDIYFMQIRPFGRDYSAAEQAGGGGGGGQQSTPGSLSRQQRDVVAATFNVLRDRATLDDRTLRQNTSTVNLAQGRVREQAEELATQLVQRGVVASDTTFRTVADALRLAVGAMRQAEEALATRRPDDALPAEQRALQQLQRAEAAFRETSVARGGGGGGGGGGGQQSAEELADLFELETDKLQNQYETVQRGQQAQAQQAADSVAERLRELAERQQRENERMQQLAQRLRSQSAGGGGGGGSQRQLAQETEEAARQLERLAREQRSPELQETARSLREAADAMRRSAGNNAQNGAGAGAAALEQLRQAQRRLEEQRGQSLEERVRDAARQAGEIADRQRQLAGEAQRTATSSAAERAARGQRLGEDKEALAGQVQDLENQLAAAAREARAGQPEAARKLQDAAVGIRQNQLADKLRFSANVARGGSPEYSRNIEEQLGEELGALRDQVSAAAGAIRADEGRREDRVLERARELARALESMRARGERRGRDGQDGQDGRNGQRGLQGEQGQRGQQGQAGQQGQQGQAGREGQAGQRGQQGGQGQAREQGQQGQRGQQGQQGQGGQRGQQQGQQQGQGGGQGTNLPTDGARLPGARGSMQVGGSGQGGGAPQRGAYSAEEARQLASEARERRRELEGLRREVAGQGQDVGDLEQLLDALRTLESRRAYDDPEEVARLQQAVTEGFKAFEFSLRRAIQGDDPARPLLDRSAAAPAEYRQLVEEYYRSLARPRRP